MTETTRSSAAQAGAEPAAKALGLTPSQTVGPFLHIGLPWPDGPDVVPIGTPGRITIRGRVLDGAGVPLPDALVETWQADPDGRFDHPDDPRGAVPGPPGFRAFGRSGTDIDGAYVIHTLRPGPLPAPDGGVEAPHVNVTVLARGLLDRLVTRIYFPEERQANAADPVLTALGDRPERATLFAVPAGEDEYRFDIHLQGPDETVFFQV